MAAFGYVAIVWPLVILRPSFKWVVHDEKTSCSALGYRSAG